MHYFDMERIIIGTSFPYRSAMDFSPCLCLFDLIVVEATHQQYLDLKPDLEAACGEIGANQNQILNQLTLTSQSKAFYTSEANKCHASKSSCLIQG